MEKNIFNIRSITLGLMLVAGLLIVSVGSRSFMKPLHAEEIKLEIKASTTIKEVLQDRVGKRLILRMQSGEDIDGTVTMVGNSLVHLSRLAGKDFYDAVVGIDRISAVILRERDH